MRPYYSHAGITIYHGDCREILPHLPKVDAVITDPPYGIAHRRGTAKDRGKGVSLGCVGIQGDAIAFDPSRWLTFPEVIMWGANFFSAALPAGRWLIWDKQEHGGSGDFSEAEIAWHSKGNAIKMFRHMWLGVQRASEVGEERLHPTQKPVALMAWCIGQCRTNPQTILDPFMGSGTTLVAAKNLGRKAIGIEIEERYCAIAVQRLQQEVFDFGGVCA